MLNAQEFRSTLTGRIVDPTGAVIVGAKVKAIEMDTGSSYETATNGDGLYTFPLLLPGRYELTAQAAGFERFSQKGIQINADSKISQDVKLAVGVTTDTITVVSDAAPLESIRVSAAQSITAHVLQNLPLDGHTALDAEYLGFAVISQENRDANAPSSNAGFATITMGGAAQGANEILLDGVSGYRDPRHHGPAPGIPAAARLGDRSEDRGVQYGRRLRRRRRAEASK